MAEYGIILEHFSLSIPQSEETRAELSQIAWVPRQVSWIWIYTTDKVRS